MIQPKLVEGFGFTGSNATWDAVIGVLDESVAIETETAISRETIGEDRIHASGRAEALNDFKLLLMQLRDQARQSQGL
jgi:hypothetical protein